MAKQMIVFALIIFLAAVGMSTAEENNVSAATKLAPAAAASGVDPSKPNQMVGSLEGPAADGAPVGGPTPQGAFKNLAPSAEQPKSGGGASLKASVVVGSLAVVGSLFFF